MFDLLFACSILYCSGQVVGMVVSGPRGRDKSLRLSYLDSGPEKAHHGATNLTTSNGLKWLNVTLTKLKFYASIFHHHIFPKTISMPMIAASSCQSYLGGKDEKKNFLSRLNDFPFEEKMTFFLLKASFNHILHFDIYWRLRQKIHSRWAKIKSHKWLFWKFWAVMTQLGWVAASFKSYLSLLMCCYWKIITSC